MSLYQVQKLLYELNRDSDLQKEYASDEEQVLARFRLTEEERYALTKPDIGLLYVLGVNGQILMHYAALKGYAWPEYIQAMRDGLEKHGAVREGFSATTDGKGAI